MARRRKITGAPLLLATAGMALAVGCSGNGRGGGPVVTGNLMPPPKMTGTVCVDVEPSTASVQIGNDVLSERCKEIEWHGAEVQVSASAPGYAPQTQSIVLDETKPVEVQITLAPEALKPLDPPRGNLMPPPEILEKPPVEK